jgi:Outer membrane protein beta-barrel domain
MRRILLSVTAVCFVAGFIATPVASAQQSVNFWVGGFAPIGIDSRDRNDVLVGDRNVFVYDFNHLTGATVGGEWIVALGDHFEAGAGLGYYQKSTTAIDRDFVDPNGFNIAANLKLRTVPFSATFRAIAFGHDAPVQPYIGAGVGIYGWKYSETGDFVLANGVISRGEVNTASGTAVGPIVLGGVRFPIGPTAPGFEIRWQKAKGELPGNGTGDPFLGCTSSPQPCRPVIDLGGFNYLFTFNVRF